MPASFNLLIESTRKKIHQNFLSKSTEIYQSLPECLRDLRVIAGTAGAERVCKALENRKIN